MNNDEILSLIDQMKAQGLDEEKIMDSFYETFKRGEMDRKDLETLASALGYELVDDFKEDSTPDPIEGEAPAAEGISKEEAEDLKEIKPEESKEEFEEKVEEAKEGEPEVEEKEEEKVEEKSEEKEDSEDDERKEAMKLFDLD
jgi:hypothetical protein